MAKPVKSYNDKIQEKAIVFPLPFKEGQKTKILPILLVEDGKDNIYTTLPVPQEKFALAVKKTLAEKKIDIFAWPALAYMGFPRGIKVFLDKDKGAIASFKNLLKSKDPRLVEITLAKPPETLQEKVAATVNNTEEAKPATSENMEGKRLFALKGHVLVITKKFETSMRAALVDHDIAAE